ncbi:MAG: type II toxin-antitoxin system VapC family toxin [Actinobacteria bacterium]|nr:type II toxin-antitoxin system VapC family toxin [Actinomycetota bacterium]
MNYSEEFTDFKQKEFSSCMVSERDHETVIFDSSVIFKWYHFEKEDNLEISKMLYEKTISKCFHVLSPDLLIYELVNIFRFRTDIYPELLKKILEEISIILIFIRLENQDYVNAYEVSRKTGSSIYDSMYIAISEKYRAQFVTADKKLYRIFKPLNYGITMLEDFLS